MPNIDDILREKTFKDGVETDQRVYYTLTDEDRKHQAHRNSKLLASLLKLLVEKGLVSEPELDGLLFECIH